MDAPQEGCVLLICDHATNRFPEGYGTLGLPESQLKRHIAYDIGAANVTRLMAEELGASAILSRFSRLFIDPNRGLDDPTLIMRLSDGAIIPGNAEISAQEIEKRISGYHMPYHQAIDGLIDKAIAAGSTPALISIHSFTHVWAGANRPWHVTILWDKDARIAHPLVESLRSEKDLVVGENEPYIGRLKGDCMYAHGTSRGLPHALIEIRQDLIASEQGQKEWAERLAHHLRGLLADPVIQIELKEVVHFGSHSD